jgi:hypothetical protein
VEFAEALGNVEGGFGGAVGMAGGALVEEAAARRKRL